MYGSTWAAAAKEPSFPLTTATAVFGQRKGESHIHRQQQKMSSGLLRFSSAPSSFLDEILEDFISPKPCSSEMESLFARFLAPNQRDEISAKSGEGGGLGGQRKRPFPPPPAGERDQLSSASSQMFYHLKHPKAENLNQVVSSMSMEAEQKKSNGAGANLLRQSSSPAGLLSNVNVNSGTGLMRGTAATIWSAIEADHGLKSQISLPSRQNPVSQLSEMISEGMTDDERTPKKNINASCFAPGYSVTSWEDSLLSDNITGDSFVLSQIELQDGTGLSHQFSFPTTTSEIDAIDKYLHYQDSIPCKTRAKRGCATHPRSIAERVRRTRISQRMRKLQELFPNMDKQTSTSDMLDLAVEYIKDLQKQVKLLSEEKAACRCSARK